MSEDVGSAIIAPNEPKPSIVIPSFYCAGVHFRR